MQKRKITIYTDKGSTKTLDVPSSMENYNLQAMLGEKVGVWYDGKNKPTNVEVITQKAKYDAIEITKIDEVRLISEDKKYELSMDTFEASSSKNQFTFYLDGKKMDIIGDRQSSREFIDVEAMLATVDKKWFTLDFKSLKSIILDPKTIVFDTEHFTNRVSDISITTWGALRGSSQVASMIFDENNIIIAFSTDKPPKLAGNLKNNLAIIHSEPVIRH